MLEATNENSDDRWMVITYSRTFNVGPYISYKSNYAELSSWVFSVIKSETYYAYYYDKYNL